MELIPELSKAQNAVIEKTEAFYHGFALLAERASKNNCRGLRGWHIRVLSRYGTLLPDIVSAPWINGTQAQARGLLLARNEMARLGEEPPSDNPQWWASN